MVADDAYRREAVSRRRSLKKIPESHEAADHADRERKDRQRADDLGSGKRVAGPTHLQRAPASCLDAAAPIGPAADELRDHEVLAVRGRTEVAGALLALVTARGVQLDEQAIVVAALERARVLRDIDFVDAYVAEKAAGDGLAVASFDKALHKKLGTTIFPL